MNIHKSSRLTPIQRKEICSRYYNDRAKASHLADEYHVTLPTIYKIIKRGREKDFSLHKSANARYRCLEWGIRRLAKVEKELEEKLKKEARRYNKNYLGQMIHMDTKRLPLLEGETPTKAREYLFVAIDDFSKELFTAIMPDKTSVSARKFLDQVTQETAYTIETVYTDNGREYKGNPKTVLPTQNGTLIMSSFIPSMFFSTYKRFHAVMPSTHVEPLAMICCGH